MSTKFDVIVIGAGPAGYHAAIRAAQLHDVNIITPLIGQRFSPGAAKESEFWWRDL